MLIILIKTRYLTSLGLVKAKLEEDLESQQSSLILNLIFAIAFSF